jgi:O-acetyl-ADP-ribose deacetylase (regulator of RNase III)
MTTQRINTKFVIWKGDVTLLPVECIVNAANESGMGCSIPGHCLDSAIHFAAGPELKESCSKLNGIPTGEAKMTPGFKLPCKYIIHVTGPKVTDETPKPNFQKLKESYIACLELANKHKIKEIAFCCLSTGIFGFPKQESADVALNTIQIWLKKHPEHKIEKVIFATYTYEDLDIYTKLFQWYKNNGHLG